MTSFGPRDLKTSETCRNTLGLPCFVTRRSFISKSQYTFFYQLKLSSDFAKTIQFSPWIFKQLWHKNTYLATKIALIYLFL
ncbi:hypothetical protein BpHYR1_036825 [Brachionus plicatilis]|uniref:Uncharacterized protein n=1 Tax=Brachionus plicatilis TaxID=10195 RepID=A0A3M7RGX8_BRAPC|nr:hypothetical protein BpHYR1_036825 [Brachionus plicatilis]